MKALIGPFLQNVIKANKVGNPIVKDGVASNFSTGNNFTFPQPLNFNGQTWEIVFKVKTSSSTTTIGQNIIGNYGNTYQNVPELGLHDTGKWGILIPKDGTSTYLISSTEGTYSVQPNTVYWLKFYYHFHVSL